MHAPRARQRPQRLLSVGLRADGKEEEAGDFGRRAEGQERGSSSPVAENLMTKIVLSASRDIPLNKLVLSQANVRRIKAGVSVEELAEDITLQTVRIPGVRPHPTRLVQSAAMASV